MRWQYTDKTIEFAQSPSERERQRDTTCLLFHIHFTIMLKMSAGVVLRRELPVLSTQSA